MSETEKNLTVREAQAKEKPSIELTASRQLSAQMQESFARFLAFLKSEDIKVAWKAINGYNMNYKGKRVGAITIGAGGWLDDAINTKDYVLVLISSSDSWDYSSYLEGQSEAVGAYVDKQMSFPCIHCRPTCGCSKVSGRSFIHKGVQLDNVCNNAACFKFYTRDSGMETAVMCTCRAVYPPEEVGEVAFGDVEMLIRARKAYIIKDLLKK